MPDQPHPRRRFQFRLRTLMIGVTLLAVVCAASAQTFHEWQIVRKREAWISGHQQCREPWRIFANCHRFAEKDASAGPSWFRILIGDQTFEYVMAGADENGAND